MFYSMEFMAGPATELGPSESAMQVLLELVAYLITTKSWGIRASLDDTPETTQLRNEEETRQPDNPWAHFSDTDHAGNREIQNRRRSQNCYIACHRGMPVYWKSSVSSVAFACAEIGEAHADISSGAAEIYGSANASMDAMYIRYVAEECNFEFPIPIELQVDNKTAIAYHKSDVNRTKLIAVETVSIRVRHDMSHHPNTHIHCTQSLAGLGEQHYSDAGEIIPHSPHMAPSRRPCSTTRTMDFYCPSKTF